jgi:hypothetical protein
MLSKHGLAPTAKQPAYLQTVSPQLKTKNINCFRTVVVVDVAPTFNQLPHLV